MSIHHPLDTTGKAGDDGERAEKSFADRFYNRFKVKLKKTDTYRDCVEHVDYDGAITDKDGNMHISSWEVKSVKHGQRHDSNYLSDQVWVEFVTKGNLGWLYGKADWVAFELEYNGKFVCVNRKQLLEYCEINCHPPFVISPRQAYYRFYVRGQKNTKGELVHDIVSLIEKQVLFDLEHWEL